jgi:hypothetical protein
MSTARHSFNPLTSILTVSPAFLKNASRMDSEEFKIIQKLRTDYGMITIQEEKPELPPLVYAAVSPEGIIRG